MSAESPLGVALKKPPCYGGRLVADFETTKEFQEGDVLDRVAALSRMWAEETAENREKEAVTIGAIALVYELRWPDGSTAISHSCSDHRPFFQAGLFRAAMLNADDLSTDDE